MCKVFAHHEHFLLFFSLIFDIVWQGTTRFFSVVAKIWTTYNGIDTLKEMSCEVGKYDMENDVEEIDVCM